MGQIATLKYTDAALRANGLNAKKAFGQNFIINTAVVEDIVKFSGVNQKTLVVEIGAGLGALTEELVKVAGQVVAYEIDDDLIPLLKQQLTASNLKIIHEDFLKADLQSVIASYPRHDLFIMSNLPYYITSEILINLFTSKLPIKKIVVMMQKEVGMKLVKPIADTDKNELTLLCHFCSHAKVLKYVSKNDFLPRPNVDSVVLEFEIHKTEICTDIFDTILKIIYASRRKTLLNNLGEYLKDKNQAEVILKECNLNLKIRAENLTEEQIVKLAKSLAKEMDGK